MPMSVKNTRYDMIEIRVNGWSTGTPICDFAQITVFSQFFFHFSFLIRLYPKNQRDFDKNINDKSATLFHFLANARIMTNTFIRVAKKIKVNLARISLVWYIKEWSRVHRVFESKQTVTEMEIVNLDYVDGGADTWNMYIVYNNHGESSVYNDFKYKL